MGYTRDELQDVAVKLSLEYPNLLLEWATGVGKGLAVMKCILASKSPKKWLIVVPELVQIDNWWADCGKWGLFDQISAKVEGVVCYAGLKNRSAKGLEMPLELNLVLNECHRLSEAREGFLQYFNPDQIIMDSATVPEEIRDRLPAHFTHTVTMQQAIEWDILPKPEIITHFLELDEIDRIYEKKIKGKNPILQTAKEYYSTLSNSVTYWKSMYLDNSSSWTHKKWMLAAITRKRWIANYKTQKAKEIIQSFGNERFVVFCGSVAQAKELGGKQAVHAGNKKNNQSLIEQFNLLISNSLYVCGMMKEGMNLYQVDNGLLVQLDLKELGNKQRMGRLLRGENPKLHLICLKGTKDEKYLEEFLNSIN